MNIELEKINYYQPEIILWERIPDMQARILRIYGNQAEVRIPETIDDCLVTEIGPYCFSATSPKVQKNASIQFTYMKESEIEEIPGTHLPGYRAQDHLISADLQPDSHLPGEFGDYPALSVELQPGSRLPEEFGGYPALCGKFLKAVFLPAHVKTLFNAAFYNCRFLHTLSVGPEITGIGSDEFTNCTRLVKLVLRCPGNHVSGIALILERITTDLDIYYMKNNEDDSTIDGVVFFPEYYEWLDEVTPAHIFSRSINGEGFRMRKAFQNGLINYEKYDACLENATKTENPSVLWHLAFWRLCFPNGLEASSNVCEKYQKVLKEHVLVGVKHFIKEQKLWGLTALCELTDPNPETLLEATNLATDAQWGEGIAYLMERNRPAVSFAEKSFDFDWD